MYNVYVIYTAMADEPEMKHETVTQTFTASEVRPREGVDVVVPFSTPDGN